MEDVDLKDYYFDSEGEHTATVDWKAKVKSRDQFLATQELVIAELKAMV